MLAAAAASRRADKHNPWAPWCSPENTCTASVWTGSEQPGVPTWSRYWWYVIRHQESTVDDDVETLLLTVRRRAVTESISPTGHIATKYAVHMKSLSADAISAGRSLNELPPPRTAKSFPQFFWRPFNVFSLVVTVSPPIDLVSCYLQLQQFSSLWSPSPSPFWWCNSFFTPTFTAFHYQWGPFTPVPPPPPRVGGGLVCAGSGGMRYDQHCRLPCAVSPSDETVYKYV